ncbi:hypothetical protein [Couchioplanes caeruleus]|uniref:DUF3040 family protein n=2 Tax=Couchioplanes caeruleus TaxID=56438 RepID=A0A1K0FK80_9ACTN|nr:hypothetical protein [Couchioplanes caeruleus]OJF13144.1 hypothetical protein BG844_16870 [Couchioplanes caeruleus subsp. caeruleus]ROP28120.1 hypothetical protein EDD30_0829 [Couchioplanes caeruleus]
MISDADPSAVPPSTGTQPIDPEADARFAAYVASLRADVDDPVHGEEYRALLAEDPEFLRALFDVADAHAAPAAAPFGVAVLVTVLIACLGAGALLVFVLSSLG